jgi:perosamine synthetase
MIPISKPFLGKEEYHCLEEVILSGWVTQGPKVKQFEESYADYVGAKHACAVSNCTTALHLALLAVGVKPGDIFLTVSHSYIATSNCIRHCGAEPVFVDIGNDNYNMCPDSLDQVITNDFEQRDGELYYKDIDNLVEVNLESPLRHHNKKNNYGRLAGVLVVHQMGMPCDISKLLKIANKYSLPVVEDAACAIGSEIFLDGSWDKIGKCHGDIVCFSLHPRKVLTTGEGGMLTTNNKNYDEYFRLLRQHGMNLSDLLRHGSSKVLIEDHITTGFNYRMTDIQAAIGIEQLKKVQTIVDERNEIHQKYIKLLSDITWLELPNLEENKKTNWQSYPLRVKENAPVSRDELMQILKDNGISSKPGVMNAHTEKPYSGYQWSLPNSEKARQAIIILPMYNGLNNTEIELIIKVIKKI